MDAVELKEPEYTIDLDCPPGNPRPSDLFPGVIKETELTEEDFALVGQFMGNWCWALKPGEERKAKYETARPTIKARVEALYHGGRIRYGSW